MLLHKSIAIVILSLSLFSFSNCGSTKKNSESSTPGLTEETFQQNPPFTIEKATSQKWVAGTQDGGTGVKLEVFVSNVKEGVVFKDLYFRGKVTEAKTNPRTRVKYVGDFKNEKKDFVMDSDPVKEAQNTPREGFPFKLKDNEAVISYEYKGKPAYYKITNIEALALLAMPAQRPNGFD